MFECHRINLAQKYWLGILFLTSPTGDGAGAAILRGHLSPRRSSCLQAKASTFFKTPSICPDLWIEILTSYSAVKCSADWPNPNNTKTSKPHAANHHHLLMGVHPKKGCKVAFNNNQSTYSLIFEYPTIHSFLHPPPPKKNTQILHTLLFPTSSGRTAYSQEHLKTITYNKQNLGGNQIESTCIMGHSTIVSCEKDDTLLLSAVKLASEHTTGSCNSRLHSLRFSSHFFNNCFADFLVSFFMSFLWGFFA